MSSDVLLSDEAAVAAPLFVSARLMEAVRFTGVGLHSGEACAATVSPAPAGAGICFYRTDGAADGAAILATAANVVETRLGTVIGAAGGDVVRTIEHLMAALALCGIYDATVAVDGPEIPILDGSAAEFVDVLRAKAVPGGAPVAIGPNRRVSVRDGDRRIDWRPAPGAGLAVAIAFDDAAIGRSAVRLDRARLDASTRRRLARARTFCRLGDVEAMRGGGLALGGSLDNAVVVDGGRVLNEDGLRDADEFALHKALDLIGDLHLLGAPLSGEITAVRPGHDLNVAFVRAVEKAVR
ncbi:MAG: UDP-3-O-acyl-N-acetylglucosamine deacetylase [Pseudomonadota bacterium]